ncbi:MAG: hypothetical protein MI976_03175 [Pseudomonadales bacterium]|nr:hypothetical protein [Pseudomonadales bacterium]
MEKRNCEFTLALPGQLCENLLYSIIKKANDSNVLGLEFRPLHDSEIHTFMKAILLLYLQICRMRVGPEEVPAVTSLTFLTLLAYMLLTFVARISIGDLPIDYSAASFGVITGFWCLLVYAVLSFKGVANRFQQTFTAAIGTDIILTCLSLPLVVLATRLPSESPLVQLAAVLWLVIFVWDVLIKGFIFHRAFQVSPLLGNLFALMVNLLVMLIDQSLLTHLAPELKQSLQSGQ